MRLVFDGPGWGGCRGGYWFWEIVNGKKRRSQVRYGEVIDSERLNKDELDAARSKELFRVVKKSPPSAA